MVKPKQLGHLVLKVRDIERSEQFYTNVGSVSVCLTRFQIYSRLVYSLSPNHNCCNLPASTAQYVIS